MRTDRQENRVHVGQRLGPYEILALEGAGGMGEVYRARDIRLNREVAIKVLPHRVAERPESLARLAREAQILASLNHPNIAAIYGVEEQDGAQALVLELVEGPTLADRIAQGRLPLKVALTTAGQIASALDAAHEHGVIHRDLKPSNIKLRPDGTVKVLDFGLAKALEDPFDGADVHTATVTTNPGVVLGTVAYMSPEQMRTTLVDKRTDIWAFGCVLFEMLSGQRAFDRKTSSDTIAAVLDSEPDLSALPDSVPLRVRALITRCLQKDRKHRLRDIGDAQVELDPSSIHAPAALPPPILLRPKPLVWLLALLAVLTGATVVAFRMSNRSPAEVPPLEFGIELPLNHTPSGGVALSPDGRTVALGAFGPGPGVWLHSFATAELRPLAGTEAPALPFWKPDGSAIGFFTRGKLHRIDRAGGPTVPLADAPNPAGGSWNASGTLMFSSDGELFTVSEFGGAVERVALPPAGERVVRLRPQFLPDHRHFLFHELGPDGGAVFVGSLDGHTAVRIVESGESAVYADEFLLFVRGSALMAQRLSADRLQLEGSAKTVANNVAPGYLSAHPEFSVSEAGVLAVVAPLEGRRGTLRWFDRSGQPDRELRPSPGTEYLNPAISPDGTRVAANRLDPVTGNWDVWIVDIARDITSRLTFGASQDADPIWSPDGRHIVFASTRNGRPGLYRTSVDGGLPEERLLEVDATDAVVFPSDWTPDGKFIIYTQTQEFPGGWQIWVLPLTGERKPFRLLPEHAFMHFAGRVSPDGKWIAYNSFESGTFETFVQPFLTSGQRTQISNGGGVHSRWNANGRELMYWAYPLGGISSVTLDFSGSTFRASAPRSVIPTPPLTLTDGRPHYDVTRDGQRFLSRQPSDRGRGAEISVITNWKQRLK